MNDIQSPILKSETGAGNTAIGAVDLLLVMARHKKLIIALPLVAGAITAAVSLTIPDTYKAGAKLLPAQQAQSGAAAVLAQLGGVVGGAAAGGLKNSNDLYIGMLKSRTIADRLVAQYDLKTTYETTSAERARFLLASNTTIVSGKDGLITIEVEDRDKTRVAKLANSYVEQLLLLSKTIALTEASQRRLFFERQLELTKDNLAKAEATLKSTLGTRGVISVDADSRAIVETVGRLRAQMAAKEIELSAMAAFVTPNHQEFRRAEQERNSLRTELNKLENGSGATLDAAPATPNKQAGLENIKVLREVKYHQMLYELLAKQYEVARLDEAKDSPNFQVLDSAVEPERKFKPKRAFIVMMAGFLGLLVAIAAALILEGKKRTMGIPERAAKWNEFRRLIAGKSTAP